MITFALVIFSLREKYAINIMKNGCMDCNKTAFEIVVLETEKTNSDVVTAKSKPVITDDFRFFLFNLNEPESINGDRINNIRNAARNLKKLRVKGFISLLTNLTDIPMKPKRNPARIIGMNLLMIYE